MKKSLVLAMAMALGVTASAYAANPFSDVPAGHWAYDSIDKLAAAGVIDGMGDGTFQGNKTMTRYEMAQIVAKAMAKGANVDKLAAEFADELDNLGVRVAKLEKKADNVTITGSFKARAWSNHASASPSNHKYTLRSDLFITGKVNEDWSYVGHIRNDQTLSGDKAGVGEETPAFKDAFVTGRIGGLNVQAGRYNDYLEDGDIQDERHDGIIVSYGKKVKLTASYAQSNDQNGDGISNDHKIAYARLDTKVGAVDAHVGYYAIKDLAWINDDSNIFTAGIALPVAKNLKLAGTYFHSDAGMDKVNNEEIDQDGFTVALDYKGADASKVGSYGISAKYYDLPANMTIYHTMDGVYPAGEHFKGYKVSADVVLAKNITYTLSYYGIEGKDTGKHYDTVYNCIAFAF